MSNICIMHVDLTVFCCWIISGVSLYPTYILNVVMFLWNLPKNEIKICKISTTWCCITIHVPLYTMYNVCVHNIYMKLGDCLCLVNCLESVDWY